MWKHSAPRLTPGRGAGLEHSLSCSCGSASADFLRDDRVQIRCLGFRIRERSASESVDEDNSREMRVWR